MKNLTKNILNALEDAYSNEEAVIKNSKSCNNGYSIKKKGTILSLLQGDDVVVSVKSNLYSGLIATIFQAYIEY